MRLLSKILFLILILSTTAQLAFSQNDNYNFKLVDSLVRNNNSDAIKLLESYLNNAQEEKDTLALIEIYDYYAKYFENDTTNDNEKKFLFQKIIYLKKITHTHKNDTSYLYSLVYTYDRLANYYIAENEFYTAIDIFFRMIFISQKLKDKSLESTINNNIGKAYERTNTYSRAKTYYKKSLVISREIGDSNLVFESLFALGKSNYATGKFTDAISYLYSALYIAEFSKNEQMLMKTYNQMAKIFFDIGFYEKASDFTEKSLSLLNKNEDNFNLRSNGVTYLFCGRNYYELHNYEKALECYEKSLHIFNYLGDKKHLGDVFCNIGKLYTKTKDFESADEYLSKALLVRKKLDSEIDLIDSYIALGNYYYIVKEYTLAKYYLLNAHKLSQKLSNFQYILQSSSSLYEIFKTEDNFQEALMYHEAFKSSSDSINKQSSNIYIEKLEIENKNKKYSDEMNKKLDNLSNSKTRLVLFIILLSLSFIGVAIFSFIFIRKSRIASHQKSLIEKQKQIILKQYERYKMLALVASHTNNSIFIMTPGGKITWVNDSLLKLYNTSFYAIFEENNADFRKLTNYPNIDEIFHNCTELKKPYTYVSQIIVNEQKTWIQTEVSPIIEGDILTSLIGIETNITPTKKAELEIDKQKKDIEYKNKLMEIYNQELKQQKESITTQNEELRQQQEELQAHTDLLKSYNLELKRLSVAASETDNVIYIFDIKGKLLWINNAFTKHTGYTYEDFLEVHGDNILKASTFPDIAYYFFVCVEQKKSVKYISEFLTKFGKMLWVQTTLSPIIDKDGKVKEIVAVDSDITDIKEAEQKITSQNREIKSSLEYAGRIQKSVLPLPIFIEAIFEKYFIFNKPRDIVSGDFYFVHYFNDKAVIALADSTGHGIPGAFMSLLGTMAFKIVMSKVNSMDANIILKMLNSEMIRLLHQRGRKNESADSIDVALCVFDLQKNLVEYAGANIPLFIVRENEEKEVLIQRIKPSKVTIGFDKLNESFTVHSFHLNKGDRLYMSSDGFADQFGGQYGKKLKRRNFMDMLKNFYHTPYYKQEESIEIFLNEWMGGEEQVDDILVIGIEA